MLSGYVKKKNVSSDVISIVIDALNYKYEEI